MIDGGESRKPIGALILIGIGVLILLGNFGLLQQEWLRKAWPVAVDPDRRIHSLGSIEKEFLRKPKMSDPTQPVCHCPYCKIRGLLGPLMIITVGILFLIGEYTRFSFMELWPILLIVAGVVLTARSLASKEGHLGS